MTGLTTPQLDDLTRLVRTKVWVCPDCGCWLWTGGCDTSMYPKFKLRGRTIQVHRYSYESLVGPIPEGLTVDHLNCTLRRCIRPDHFELIEALENTLRANATRWHDVKFTADGAQVPAANCLSCRERFPMGNLHPNTDGFVAVDF